MIEWAVVIAIVGATWKLATQLSKIIAELVALRKAINSKERKGTADMKIRRHERKFHGRAA